MPQTINPSVATALDLDCVENAAAAITSTPTSSAASRYCCGTCP